MYCRCFLKFLVAAVLSTDPGPFCLPPNSIDQYRLWNLKVIQCHTKSCGVACGMNKPTSLDSARYSISEASASKLPDTGDLPIPFTLIDFKYSIFKDIRLGITATGRVFWLRDIHIYIERKVETI